MASATHRGTNSEGLRIPWEVAPPNQRGTVSCGTDRESKPAFSHLAAFVTTSAVRDIRIFDRF
jgi:hypothetical protein